MNSRRALVTFGALLCAAGNASATDHDILFDGCDQVGPGPTCYIAAGNAFDLWLNADVERDWLVTLNDQPMLPDDTVSTPRGRRLTFTLGGATGALKAKASDDTTTFTLRIELPANDDALVQINDAVGRGDYNNALHMLNSALAAAAAGHRAELLRAKARIHWRRDEHVLAQGLFRAAILAAREHGQHYSAIRSATALAFSLRQHQRDTSAAQQVLNDVADLIGQHASAGFLWAYHAGMVAFTNDDTRTQLRHFTAASNIAERLGQTHRMLRSDTRLAVVRQNLGQRQTAGNLLDTWAARLPESLPGCERAVFWTNLGWNRLLELEARESATDPVPVLNTALELADAHCATTEQVNARLNLALAHWHAGEWDTAAEFLAAGRQLTPRPATHLVLWGMDIEARIHASRGDFERALTLYETLTLRAQAASLPGTQWRALIRQAWVLRLAGRPADAIAVHRVAESALDEQVLRVPLQAGRETLLATRRFAMREHLSLLHATDRLDDALALVQRESSRAVQRLHVAARIAQLEPAARTRFESNRRRHQTLRNAAAAEQAASWQLSKPQFDALKIRAERRNAQLRLLLDDTFTDLLITPAQAVAPSPRPYTHESPLLSIWQTADGWSVLLNQGGTVVGEQPDCPAPQQSSPWSGVAACLLNAMSARLKRAQSISLLVDETFADIDWHALPTSSGLWIDQAAMRYVTGLPATQRATPGPGLALLVGDPSGNLGAARDEVGDIQKHLRNASAWRDATLLGANATVTAVRRALATSALFHYAGHAVFGERSGWDSALLLADDTRFGIGDILTLDTPPQLVVLSGCETARGAGVVTPTMGLASAFLASGSSAVIATTRSVDDLSARTLSRAFYTHWLNGLPVDQALRAAQRQTRDEQPHLDWSAFRLIEP